MQFPLATPTSSTGSNSSVGSNSSTESRAPSRAAEQLLDSLEDETCDRPARMIIPAPKNILPPAVPHNIVFVGCPLCLEPAVQPCVTRCGHVFCNECINQALDATRNCPVCHLPVGHGQLKKIFLTTPASGADA